MEIQWCTDPEFYVQYLHVGYACAQLKGVTAVRDSHANVIYKKKNLSVLKIEFWVHVALPLSFARKVKHTL